MAAHHSGRRRKRKPVAGERQFLAGKGRLAATSDRAMTSADSSEDVAEGELVVPD